MWLVVRHEYLKHVSQKGFLIALFSLPLLIGLSVGLGMIMGALEDNSNAVGFVDKSGILDNPIALTGISELDRIEFIEYSDEKEALAALEERTIQAYFVLPEIYPNSRKIDLFFNEEPGENAVRDIYDFIQLNLLSGFSPEIRNRVTLGSNLITRTPNGQREFPDNEPTVSMFLPLIIGFGFVLLMLISSGFFMSGFLDEKSNRTIELIVTSLSTAQFVGSKLLMVLAIALTMLVVWILVGTIAISVGGNLFHLTWIEDITINWRDILAVGAVALPSYAFVASFMLAIGLVLGDNQEAESIGPMLFVVAFIPLWFGVSIARDINGSLAMILSFLPLASLLTIAFRSMFIQVPLWQILISITIQLIFLAGALWLAVRSFQIGILRTGNRIRWEELFSKKSYMSKKESG
jgi:ABC-2 type transport system permease protein